ncbi:hypothetical protein HPS8415995_0781 [Glaesserella parasuis 84-15995]|nr:hypothetical protein HPS8415995_0781 [Glaesserella parasuis 84-15995]
MESKLKEKKLLRKLYLNFSMLLAAFCNKGVLNSITILSL